MYSYPISHSPFHFNQRIGGLSNHLPYWGSFPYPMKLYSNNIQKSTCICKTSYFSVLIKLTLSIKTSIIFIVLYIFKGKLQMKNDNKIKKKIIDLVIYNQTSLIINIIIISSICLIVLIGVDITLTIVNKKAFNLIELLQVISYGIGIPTFAITAIQISNYLYHAKYEIKFKRKIQAVELSQFYASKIVREVGFVTNVLKSYLTTDEYQSLVSQVPTNFNVETYKKLNIKAKIDNIFERNETPIDPAHIKPVLFLSDIFRNENYDFKDIKEEELPKEYHRRFRGTILSILNSLEWFAMEINEGLADEDTLFVPLHKSYLEIIEEVYPIICKSNIHIHEEMYTNVLKLYRLWKQKKDENENRLNNEYSAHNKSESLN